MVKDEILFFKKIVDFAMAQLIDYIKRRNDDYRINGKEKAIDERVYQENLTVFEEELLYISRIKDFIARTKLENFNDINELKEFIDRNVKEFCREQGAPGVCYVIIKDKLESCLKFYNDLINV